jgi:acyl dehydratase
VGTAQAKASGAKAARCRCIAGRLGIDGDAWLEPVKPGQTIDGN